MFKISLPILTGVALVLSAVLNYSPLVLANQNHDKVTICHRAASNSNPYTVEQPDKSGNVDGHDGHNGPVYPNVGSDGKWGDIIPPFDYDHHHYNGKNWTSAGQAIYNNGCNIPSPSPSPRPSVSPIPSVSPSPSPSPSPSVSPSPSTSPSPTPDVCNQDGANCNTGGEPTPSPSVSPSPTPFEFPNCLNQTGFGDIAHYVDGTHWIVGDGLLIGRDDVYSLGDQRYMQCYCPETANYVSGNEGIQTNWESAHTTIKPTDRPGYFLVWGPDFGLDQSWFYATGADKPSPTTPNFDCGEPASTTSTGGSNTSNSGGSSNNNSSNNNSGGSSSNNNPQILGATTLANTGASENLMIFALGFASIFVGLYLLAKRSGFQARV